MAEKQVLTKQRKKWHPILAPDCLGSVLLAEIPALKPEDLIGRVLEVNLSQVMQDVKKQNLNADFKIIEIKQGRGVTSLLGFKMMLTALKRMARKDKDKIEDSFVCKSKDGIKLRIKPILIAKSRVNRAKQAQLRKLIRENITQMAGSMSYEDLFMEMIRNKLQMAIKEIAKKVSPLYMVQIRQALIVKS